MLVCYNGLYNVHRSTVCHSQDMEAIYSTFQRISFGLIDFYLDSLVAISLIYALIFTCSFLWLTLDLIPYYHWSQYFPIEALLDTISFSFKSKPQVTLGDMQPRKLSCLISLVLCADHYETNMTSLDYFPSFLTCIRYTIRKLRTGSLNYSFH